MKRRLALISAPDQLSLLSKFLYWCSTSKASCLLFLFEKNFSFLFRLNSFVFYPHNITTDDLPWVVCWTYSKYNDKIKQSKTKKLVWINLCTKLAILWKLWRFSMSFHRLMPFWSVPLPAINCWCVHDSITNCSVK